MPLSLDRLLSELEEAKRHFGDDAAERVLRLIRQIEGRNFKSSESLIRFHEALLFLRSHPQSQAVFEKADLLLDSFVERVERLRSMNADLTAFDYIEYSGIAGTRLSGTFSYDIARWIVENYPSKADVNWDKYEKRERLAGVLPQLLPLFYEDSMVEANVPHLTWIHTAKPGGEPDLDFLIRRFDGLAIPEKQKSELYNLLELPVQWDMAKTRASRTRNIRRVRKVFHHTGPLIRRNEVSLEKEINSPLTKLTKLTPAEGKRTIDMLRATTTVRYRELYGITHGDPSDCIRAEVGRGVEIFLWGLPAARRLPLRAYHAGFTLKNGVPINYIEGITLFERMELGFNMFYTFRDGESAWVYAQALRLLHQTVGATCFSIDPYQIGFNNEEAIESGAFWFYRKMGFRPTRPELQKLIEAEEKKIASSREYKTPARSLRRLSRGHIIYELPHQAGGGWDRFEVRNVALAVAQRLGEEFKGDARRLQDESSKFVARALNMDQKQMSASERAAFENLSLVLALIADLRRWSDAEKQAVVRIIRAKAGSDDARYARLLQKHSRLRDWVIRIGS